MFKGRKAWWPSVLFFICGLLREYDESGRECDEWRSENDESVRENDEWRSESVESPSTHDELPHQARAC